MNLHNSFITISIPYPFFVVLFTYSEPYIRTVRQQKADQILRTNHDTQCCAVGQNLFRAFLISKKGNHNCFKKTDTLCIGYHLYKVCPVFFKQTLYLVHQRAHLDYFTKKRLQFHNVPISEFQNQLQTTISKFLCERNTETTFDIK